MQKKASGTATLAARPAARRGLRSAVAPSGLSSTSVRFAHPSGEKARYCPFWRRGSLCRAQWSWPAYACYRAHSELAFFRRQNGRAFFPPLPIAALLRRSWLWAYAPLAGWDVSMWLVYFCNAKGQRDFKSTLALIASHEACRRMAVFAIQPAGSRTRPASRGTSRATAVKPRPSRMSPEQSRALWARCGVKGYYPL